ncbi:hypothetical protein BV25DRAFT_1485866 [Artomyces pyxidatus]|uniref:Uncharacterized protein n=1 Tax=Artomyces pyxidatus TaxID=48021 RepID=A0ACB8TB29_9AGAM|nr:hypothetical protein BV25DRAFT_1485866 [Artomyces pyxidatus]
MCLISNSCSPSWPYQTTLADTHSLAHMKLTPSRLAQTHSMLLPRFAHPRFARPSTAERPPLLDRHASAREAARSTAMGSQFSWCPLESSNFLPSSGVGFSSHGPPVAQTTRQTSRPTESDAQTPARLERSAMTRSDLPRRVVGCPNPIPVLLRHSFPDPKRGPGSPTAHPALRPLRRTDGPADADEDDGTSHIAEIMIQSHSRP